MLRRRRGNGGLYQDLLNKEPHVVSITFWRDEVPIQRGADSDDDVPKPTKLGIMIDKAPAEKEGDRNGGDYQITDIQDSPDSILYGMPIEVGDRLVAVNSQPCYGLDIEMLKQMIATQTGIVTLTLRKTKMAPFQDELRLAVFIDSQKHTCIPMDICLFKEEEKLSIFALYDHFDMDTKSKSNKNKNDWLESSCLAEGQVLLSVNDRPTFNLEEDDAHAIMNETLNTDEVLAIKTYFPSRASTNETPDMVDRVTSYIIQLEHRITRSLAQARNENDDLNFSASVYPVFSSAVQLDKTLRGACNRCLSISTGKPLFRLYLLMEDAWAKYAKVLIRNFPQDSRFSKVWRKRLGKDTAKYAQQPAPLSDNSTKQTSAQDSSDEECDINGAPTFESVETDIEEKKKDSQDATQTSSSGRGWFFSRRQQESGNTVDKTVGQDAESSKDGNEARKTKEPETSEKSTAPNQSRSWFFGRKTSKDDLKSLDGDENNDEQGKVVSASDPKDKEFNIRAEICHVVCTGSYCLNVIVERENSLKEKIDERFKIDFEQAKTVFREEVIDKGVLQLVDSVKFQAEPIFAKLTRIRWHRCEEVGDTSPYAVEVVLLLKQRITSLAVQLPPMIHRKFKYDLVQTICEVFYASLTKINRISAIGTQQLLLDVATLKVELFALLRISEPSTNSDCDFADARMEDPKKFVNELLKKPEALLKLAGTNVGVDELLGTLDGKPIDEGAKKVEAISPKNEASGEEPGSGSPDDDVMYTGEVENDADGETTIVFDHLEDMGTSLEAPAFSKGFDLDDEEPEVE